MIIKDFIYKRKELFIVTDESSYFVNKGVDKYFNIELNAEIDIDKLLDKSDELNSYARAIRYLSRYSSTEYNLIRILRKHDHKDKSIKEVIKKLKELNYIDDLRYSLDFYNSKKDKYGKNYIRNKLYQKGVKREIIEKIEFEENINDIINVIKKRYKDIEINYENRNKVFGYLSRRGFSSSGIIKAIEKYKRNI